MTKKIRRGREKIITCEKCGMRTPRSKTRYYYRFGRKIYLCIKCAKKSGLIGRYARIERSQ
ncbi:MAG: hypothetical protein OH319_00625 [Candidatus Parvarchaeota archaeon]|nr:hypothetical protein [Candidatus Jingweiarchaeum tengchongense]MCW1298352.1 hypothetical protein [Candidatus Jingweiarchaeum tengchongense]MCW1300346.1 hypothetical protein [Candidatus Jingweiarchaeum tengchongense]MCW1304857.1 hypothetical protein [Candidatus Jingweiarchaeum tengchongense]MCW1305842.1 hypothetical protein [Candidatus Jingweiarchaeum tengchongense]